MFLVELLHIHCCYQQLDTLIHCQHTKHSTLVPIFMLKNSLAIVYDKVYLNIFWLILGKRLPIKNATSSMDLSQITSKILFHILDFSTFKLYFFNRKPLNILNKQPLFCRKCFSTKRVQFNRFNIVHKFFQEASSIDDLGCCYDIVCPT